MTVINILVAGSMIGSVEIMGMDDGMGVAFGPFTPTPNYMAVRKQIIAQAEARSRGEYPDAIRLEAWSESGEAIRTGFVTIDDFGDAAVDAEASIQFSDIAQRLRLIDRAV